MKQREIIGLIAAIIVIGGVGYGIANHNCEQNKKDSEIMGKLNKLNKFEKRLSDIEKELKEKEQKKETLDHKITEQEYILKKLNEEYGRSR